MHFTAEQTASFWEGGGWVLKVMQAAGGFAECQWKTVHPGGVLA